jgi:thymidylate synthase (FAD)
MPVTPEQQAAIDAQRAAGAETRRATVPALEEILYQPLPVLDHGFVRVIDYMGDDGAIVQAARVSYGRGTRRAQDDAGLIDYLMRHRHSTPLEMCEIKYHVKLPIFVARQWIRHRTANVNEYSARYSVLDKEYYLPAPEHLAAQSAGNRQGRGDVLSAEDAARVLALLREDAERCHAHYFLSLRADAHAQYEIRVYAEAMLETVRRWVPLAHAAFVKNRLGAVTLSAPALAVVRRMIAGDQVAQSASGLSAREWRELMSALRRQE